MPFGRRLARAARVLGQIVFFCVLPALVYVGWRVLTAPGGHVGSVAFSPDGTRICAVLEPPGGQMTDIRVWDVFTGDCLWQHDADGPVQTVDFCGQGGRLLRWNWDCRPKTGSKMSLWDWAADGHVSTAPCVQSVCAHSPDGLLLAAFGHNGSVLLLDATTDEILLELPHVEADISHVTFSADGRYVAAMLWKNVSVWDTNTGELVGSVPIEGPIERLAVISQGCSLLTYRWQELASWDIRTGKKLNARICAIFRQIDVAPDAKTFIGYRWGDESLTLFDTAKLQPIEKLPVQGRWAAYAPNARFVAVHGHESLVIWDLVKRRSTRLVGQERYQRFGLVAVGIVAWIVGWAALRSRIARRATLRAGLDSSPTSGSDIEPDVAGDAARPVGAASHVVAWLIPLGMAAADIEAYLVIAFGMSLHNLWLPLATTQVGLAAVWAAAAYSSPARRLAPVPLAAIVWGGAVILYNQRFTANLLLSIGMLVTVIAGVLLLVRLEGFRIENVRPGWYSRPIQRPGPLRFGLKQLLIFVAVIGALLTLVRGVPPETFFDDLMRSTLMVVVETVSLLLAVFAVLGARRRWAVRILAVVLFATAGYFLSGWLGAGWTTYLRKLLEQWFSLRRAGEAWEMLNAMVYHFLWTSAWLLMLRACGYRYVRHRPQPAEPALAAASTEAAR